MKKGTIITLIIAIAVAFVVVGWSINNMSIGGCGVPFITLRYRGKYDYFFVPATIGLFTFLFIYIIGLWLTNKNVKRKIPHWNFNNDENEIKRR